MPKWKREEKSEHISAGTAFMQFDRVLDRDTTGPLWLKDASAANAVSNVLIRGATDWGLYNLHAWVIMANHVHVLIRPRVPLNKALMNIKSASSRAANALLNRIGEPFWQSESYDHWVRNDREFDSIIRYIHRNPVSAGLVIEPEDWQWSSARTAAHGAALR